MAKQQPTTKPEQQPEAKQPASTNGITQPDNNPANVSQTVPTKPARDKGQSFRSLANKRVPRAVAVLKHVANLANKANYSYTPEQAEKVTKIIREATQLVIDAFKDSGILKKGEDIFGS